MLDVAKDGYYNTDMCVEDFELVSETSNRKKIKKNIKKIYNNQQAIDIVDLAFEGKYSPIFLLDNSPIHRLMIRLENNYMIAKY